MVSGRNKGNWFYRWKIKLALASSQTAGGFGGAVSPGKFCIFWSFVGHFGAIWETYWCLKHINMNDNRNLRCWNVMLKIYYRKKQKCHQTNLYHCQNFPRTTDHFQTNHPIVLICQSAGVWCICVHVWNYLQPCVLYFSGRGLMKLYQFFTGFFPEFHFCPTGDFDFPAGFHRSLAVISTSALYSFMSSCTDSVGCHGDDNWCLFSLLIGSSRFVWRSIETKPDDD